MSALGTGANPPDTIVRRISYQAVGLLALLTPVALALAVLPTPSSDTRELLAWGHFFTLSTAKHPPMMQWVGGLTERLMAPSAFAAVLINQLLTAIGLAYTHAIARLTVDADRAAIFTLLLAGSLCVIAAPLPFALNADLLQFPFWSAIVFHALKAAAANRLWHWLAFGIASAGAVYTKYTVLVLFVAMAAASVLVPDYRQIWRRAAFYASLLVAAALATPQLMAAFDSSAIGHATGLVALAPGLMGRLNALGQIILGALIWLAPAWIIIGIGLIRRDCVLTPSPAPAARFLHVTTLISFALLALLVIAAGLFYESRYDLPFLFLITLSAAALIGFDVGRWPGIERRTVLATAIAPVLTLTGGSLGYGLFGTHTYMQEPTGQAAARLNAEWVAKYACGPAYIMGDVWSAYGLAIASKPPAIGIPLEVMKDQQWFNLADLKRRGAIIVYRDQIDKEEFARSLPGVPLPPAATITLPFLWSAIGKSITYSYVFLPPEVCGKRQTP